MHPTRVKKGAVMKYKVGSVSNKWKIYQAILFSDSKLCWYEKLGVTNPRSWCNRDTRSRGFVFLKDVVPYICVGTMTDRMPVKSPVLPNGYSKHHLVGIGMDRKAETVHWILFSSNAEAESWVTEIISTLPIVNQLPHRCPIAPLGLVPVQPSFGESVSNRSVAGKFSEKVHFFSSSLANGGRTTMEESGTLPLYYIQPGDYRIASCDGGRYVGIHDGAFNKSFGVIRGNLTNAPVTSMLTGALMRHGLGSMWGQSEGSYYLVKSSIENHHYDRTKTGEIDNSTPSQAARSEVRDDGGFDHSGGHGGFDYPGVNFHSGDLSGGDHGDGFLSTGDFSNNDFDHLDFY